MEVVFFFRAPRLQYHSIERVFDMIISNLPSSVDARIYKLKYGAKGFFSRVKALLEVKGNTGKINHLTGDITYLALAIPRDGLVVTFHDLESLIRGSRVKNTILKWFWVILPARRARAVTVISEHTRTLLMKWSGINSDKIDVIYNPLPPGFSYHPKTTIEAKPLLLVIGTKYNKNLEGIIQAITGIFCKLLIVGNLSTVQMDLLSRGKVDFENLVGATNEEVIDAYIRCDLLCFPSFFEGFGMPIIEAQATGRPVITSNFGAMKEVAGEGALLVNPNNPGDIRNSILQVIHDIDLRSRLVAKGLENASRFEAKNLALKYMEVYKKSGFNNNY